METKKCTKCGEVKALDAFYRNKGKHISICGKCENAYKKEWLKKNTEEQKERRKATLSEYVRAHPEMVKENSRRQLASLPDSRVAAQLGMGVKDCPPELIEMKREQLKLRRLTKQLNQAIKEAQK